MEIGIFAKTFTRPSLDATLEAITATGIHTIQLNMSCAGLPSLPDSIPGAVCDMISASIQAHDMQVPALSGTFNMIHPDRVERSDGLRRLRILATAAHRMHIPLITLCTGTRDPQNMWRRHADNDSPEAWDDLIDAMREAIRIAEETDLYLGVEPELSNVINSAQRARLLLDSLRSPRLKIVMDGSNLLQKSTVPYMHSIFDQAFQLLGTDITLVHAKDLLIDESNEHGAAGTGILDYDHYLSWLQRIGYTGPLILHTLREDQVPASVHFLEKKLYNQTPR